MNCLSIDIKKVENLIKEYEYTKQYIKRDPILLMNEKTQDILRSQIADAINIEVNDEKFSLFFGCKIAIANWLLIGDIEIL